MAKYDFASFPAADFGQLVVDLIAEVTGSDIVKKPSNHGRAPWSFEGILRWPEAFGGEVWSGVVVVPQIVTPGRRLSWEHELLNIRSAFTQPQQPSWSGFGTSPRPSLSDLNDSTTAPSDSPVVPPDYLLMILGRSEFDDGDLSSRRIEADVASLSEEVGFRGAKVWSLSTIERLLDVASKTRLRYFARLAPTNVLSTIHTYDVGVSDNLREAVKLQAFEKLRSEQWVRLTQAGDDTNARLKLNQIGIDLPIHGHDLKAARFIVKAGDAFSAGASENANLLLLGGPGQGKSTITQLIAQSYRVALLGEDPTLNAEIRGIVAASREGFRQAGITIPSFRRWPVRIELAGYVDQAVRSSGASLLKYLLQELNEHAGRPLTVSGLRAWLRAWPMLLILDGFDEVSSSGGRETLMEHLSAFTDRVQEIGCDVFVVATTRPQGYAGEFAGRGYTDIELTPLKRVEAVHYGRQLAEVRHHADPHMLRQVTQGLDAAANEPLTERLMSSPLQVTIMSILLEANERVPRARYALFEAYYRTIYKREENKKGTVAATIKLWQAQIDALHNWLGLVLQANSEMAGDLDAASSQANLRRQVVRQLHDEDFAAPEAARHAGEILEAVVNRLVLIVPKKIDEVGFEIRSIQEFFAARAIVSDRDEDVCRRLDRIVEPAHWRHTWLFAAGRAFSERRYLRAQIIDVLAQIDMRDPVRTVVAPGADLALDLLEDDVASQSPGIQRRLYKQALDLLKYPPDHDLQRRAPVLLRFAETDDEARFLLRQALDQALLGTPGQVASARVVLQLANRGASRLQLELRPRLWAAERKLADDDVASLAGGVRTVGELLLVASERDGLDTADRERVALLAAWFEAASGSGDPAHADQPTIRNLLDECMRRAPLRELLADVTQGAAGRGSFAGRAIRDELRAWLQRNVVGEQLLKMTYPDGDDDDVDP